MNTEKWPLDLATRRLCACLISMVSGRGGFDGVVGMDESESGRE